MVELRNKPALAVALFPVGLLLLLACVPRLLQMSQTSAPEQIGSPRVRRPKPPVPPPAKPAPFHTQQVLAQTVTGQIRAMRQGDYARALTYSAPMFQRAWTPEVFERMVASGFNALPESQMAVCEPAQVQGNRATIPVKLQNRAGKQSRYVFVLSRENKPGKPQLKTLSFPQWHISGCMPAPPAASSRVAPMKEI